MNHFKEKNSVAFVTYIKSHSYHLYAQNISMSPKGKPMLTEQLLLLPLPQRVGCFRKRQLFHNLPEMLLFTGFTLF